MKSDAEWIERYLLGDLDGSELARFEDRMISDEAFFQQLEFMEDQLIEAYVRNQLPQKDRTRFKQYFMQLPRRRGQVELHLALQKRLGNQAPAAEHGRGTVRALLAWIGARPLGFAAYAACFSLAIVNAGLFWHLQGERASIERQRTGNPRTAFQLLPGAMRGTDESAFRIPPGSEPVQLQLRPSFAILPGRYSIILKDEKGAAVWKSEWTLAGGSETGDHLSVAVPGGVLREGGYVLELSRSVGSGISEPLADYRFRLTK